VYIAKGDGGTRPLGIPTLEDKLVQQAARLVLEPIYEREFLGLSYGYRPGRSAHGALNAVGVAISKKTSWVLDADIRSFFDTIDHGWLQQFIAHRIGDKRMVRLLMKWLHAGVLEEGAGDEPTLWGRRLPGLALLLGASDRSARRLGRLGRRLGWSTRRAPEDRQRNAALPPHARRAVARSLE
jgi:hypothetical protein